MTERLLVTGGDGLIGHAIRKFAPDAFFVSHKEYDLTYEPDVKRLFETVRPTQVIHLVGRVGGVGINMKQPAEFYEDNILMNTLVLKYAHKHWVPRLIAFMSTCVFPDDVKYPLKPSVINDGPPHYSNFGYAYAKRMVGVQLQAYQQQYGHEWFGIIPTNVYGPYDNFNLEAAHVIPALIHKCYLAKKNNADLWIWGSGKPEREFLYVDDLAQITLRLLEKYDSTDPIIVSTSQQVAIKDVVQMVADEMEFEGYIKYDKEKPDGQFRKPSDTTPLKEILPSYPFTPLHLGIHNTVNWFIENYNTNNIRK